MAKGYYFVNRASIPINSREGLEQRVNQTQDIPSGVIEEKSACCNVPIKTSPGGVKIEYCPKCGNYNPRAKF